MTKMMITEEALLCRLQCPLRAAEANSGPEPPVLHCAERTLQWLIAEIASGRLPDVLETHHYYFETEPDLFRRDNLPGKEYERRYQQGWRVCRLLRDILFRCQILQPVEKYELPIGGVMITGEYAVFRSSRRKRQAYVLYLRHGGLKVRPLIPDVVSFARFVDVTNRSSDRGWGVDRIGVLHYWVAQKLSALHRPDPEFAASVLRGAVGTISLPPHPRTGEHCLVCPSRNCTAATLNRECVA
jgi:hypothetical protein